MCTYFIFTIGGAGSFSPVSRASVKSGRTSFTSEDLYWVGANDHRLHLFENIHPIPYGVSYNAYLLLDRGNDFYIRITLQDLFYAGAMVRFHVIDNEPVQFAPVQQIVQVFHKLAAGGPIDGIE